jgi:HEPN domain-containing protein
MADNPYVEETPDDLFINAVRDILAVKTLLNGTFYPSDAMYIPICFHATQAVEKQIKGFIIENSHKVRKIHDLEVLAGQAVKIDSTFDAIKKECVLINQFLPNVKYSNNKIITKNDINDIIRSLAIINNFPPLKSLRDSISKKYKYEMITEISTQDTLKPPHGHKVIAHQKKKQDREPDIGY